MAVYCKDHTEHINICCEQKMWSFLVNLDSIYSKQQELMVMVHWNVMPCGLVTEESRL